MLCRMPNIQVLIVFPIGFVPVFQVEDLSSNVAALGRFHERIRYNRHAGFNESNTTYPFYKASTDNGFVEACESILGDKLMSLQWWEEDRGKDGFFAIDPGD